MPYRRSRSRRRGIRQRRKRLLVGLSAGALTCVLLVASLPLFAPGEASDTQGARESRVAPSLVPTSSADTTGRLLYPYSIVPGGVHSPEALVAAVVDRVVAEHYASIDIAHARVATISKPRRAYVSYRIGDHVYWTKHTIALHEGERLLTDGSREIRARCGNRISDTPQAPTAADEPDEAEFDRATAPTATGPLALMTIPVVGPFDLQPEGFSPGHFPFSADGSDAPSGARAVDAPFAGGSGSRAIGDTSSEGGPGGGSLAALNTPLGGRSAPPSDDGATETLVVSETDHPDGGSANDAGGPSGLTTVVPDGPSFPLITEPVTMAPVPEPGSLVLLGTGLAGCAWRAWRRRRRDR
jgi:hypothetical protein